MMRQAVLNEYTNRLATMSGFTAIGGDKAKEYALKELDTCFGEGAKKRYSIIHLLDKHGRLPSRWNVEDEENLREEMKKAIR